MTVTCDGAVRLAVMTTIREKGLKIQDFRTVEPSLEEAFVKLLSVEEGS